MRARALAQLAARRRGLPRRHDAGIAARALAGVALDVTVEGGLRLLSHNQSIWWPVQHQARLQIISWRGIDGKLQIVQNERRLALGDGWQDNDLVFPSEVGTPINPRNLGRDYIRWVEKAGVRRIRVHDQRHTHASLMLQMGEDIKVVSERLGHARTSITMDVYAHVTSRQHVEAGERIGALLEPPPSSQASG